MGRNEFVNSVEKSLRTSSARVKKSAKFFRDTIPYAGPALVVIALGIDEIKVLVFSQVALSLALPFAVIPLIMFAHNGDIMGNHRSPRAIHYLAVASALFILFLNVLLVVEAFGVSI